MWNKYGKHIKAEILIEALPYIHGLSGKTVVIKYGGNAQMQTRLKIVLWRILPCLNL